jgi:hypothetical protein
MDDFGTFKVILLRPSLAVLFPVFNKSLPLALLFSMGCDGRGRLLIQVLKKNYQKEIGEKNRRKI